MKNFFYLSIIFIFARCGDPLSNQPDAVLGAPAATVTTLPNSDTALRGPLEYAPLVPDLQEGDTVDVKIDSKHKLFNINKDVVFEGWTFGDSIPGPVLKVRVGQTIRFRMTNRSNESMDMQMSMNMKPMLHSMDFHASMVNPDDKFRSFSPGETIEFLWTANYPGVFMYHCGTPSVLMHVANGMFGMVIVEPKGGFPGKVDKEFALVQSEYYIQQAGLTYITDTAAALRKQPSFVTFNGKSGQYIIKPLRAKAGERIRIYLLNAGPNDVSGFHLIGTIFDRVWMDGNPRNETHGNQAVLLGPSNGAILEFVLPEKGLYTFLDHSLADAEIGATGIIRAE